MLKKTEKESFYRWLMEQINREEPIGDLAGVLNPIITLLGVPFYLPRG